MPKCNLTYIKRHKDSIYRGVYKTNNGWISKISIKGKQNILGPFKTEKESAKAYDKKALEIRKEKAILNILKNPYRKNIKKNIKGDTKGNNIRNKRNTKNKKTEIYIHKRAKFSVVTRNKISARQNWNCSFCKERLGSLFIVDHIVPLFLGGSNHEYNLQSLCPECDRFKTSIIDYEILKPLSQNKELTVEDVFKAQEENYHRMMCIDPTTNRMVNNNINCQQFITNSNINGTISEIENRRKKIELDISGVKIKISV